MAVELVTCPRCRQQVAADENGEPAVHTRAMDPFDVCE